MSHVRKLVIFDDNASLYEQILRAALETDWDVERGPSSTDWLSEHICHADAAIGLRLPPGVNQFVSAGGESIFHVPL